ncbi:major tail protein [uncultured Clostridium sp.]|uniref:major tail protein n=1 Tax=uncultured Clostridium sp. TaxID=59620 RepID=UPI0028ECE89C|nr:major tail protein [uncultured Clostridium sp.]
MPTDIKKTVRINVKNMVYAVLQKDDLTGVTYGPIKLFAKAMQIQCTPGLASGTIHGDGAKQAVITRLTGLTAVVDINKLNIDTRTEILGITYEEGVAIDKLGDEPKEIALGYLVEQTDNTAEYIWLLKGRPQPYASTVQQQTENINFSTDSITIEFVPREYDGEMRRFADSADSTFTKDMQDKWFKSVPGTIGS